MSESINGFSTRAELFIEEIDHWKKLLDDNDGVGDCDDMTLKTRRTRAKTRLKLHELTSEI